MALAGVAWIDFRGNFAGLNREAQKAMAGLAKQLEGQTRGVGDRAGNAITRGLGSAARAVGSTLGTALEVGATAAAGIGTAALVAGTNYNVLGQRATAAMRTVTGSTDAANQMMGQLMEFAGQSPFPRQAFIEATQQMLAFGFAAEDVIPTLSAVQDAVAASGGGAQQMQEVVFVLSQIQAAGKITGQDLMQLGQRGIDAAGLIGDTFGMTGEQVRDAITAGTIPAEKAISALTEGMTEHFGGAAAGLKSTFIGSIDSVQARLRDLGAAVVQPFIGFAGGGALVEGINAVAGAFTQFTVGAEDGSRRFTGALEPLNGIIAGIAERVQAAMTGLAGLIENVDFGRVLDIFQRFGPAIAAFGAAIGTNIGGKIPVLGQFLGGLNPVVAALGGLIAASPQLRSAFGNTLDEIGAAVRPLIGPLVDFFQTLVQAILPPLLSILPPVADAFSQVIQAIEPHLPALAASFGELATALIEALLPVLPQLADALVVVTPPLVQLVTTLANLIARIPPPVLTAIVTALAGMAVVGNVANRFGALATAVDQVGGPLAALADKFPSLATGMGLVKTAVGTLAGFLKTALVGAFNLIMAHPVIAAVAALGVAFYLLYTKCKPFRDIVDSIIDVLQAAAAPIVDLVKALVSGQGLSGALDRITGFLGPLQGLGEAFLRYLLEPIRTVVNVVKQLIEGDFTGAFRTLMGLPGRMLSLFGSIFGQLAGLVGRGIANLAGMFGRLAASALGWIGNAITQLPGMLGRFLVSIGTWVLQAVPRLLAAFGQFAVAALQWIGQAILQLPVQLARMLGLLIGFVVGLQARLTLAFGRLVWAALQWIGQTVVQLPGRLLGIATSIWNWVTATAASLAGRIASFAASFWRWIVDVVTGLPGRLASIATSVWNWITATAVALPGRIVSWVTSFFSWTTSIITNLGIKLAEIATGLWTWITNTAVALPGQIASWIGAFWSWATDIVANAATRLGEIWTAVRTWITSLPERVKNLAGAIGRALWNGIKDGLGNLAEKGKDVIGGMVDGIKEGVTSGFGLFSPSRVFIDYGSNMMAGLEQGMGQAQAIQRVVGQMTAQVTAAFGRLNATVAAQSNAITARLRAWAAGITAIIGAAFARLAVGGAGFARLGAQIAAQTAAITVRLRAWAAGLGPIIAGAFTRIAIGGNAFARLGAVIAAQTNRITARLVAWTRQVGAVVSRGFAGLGARITAPIAGWTARLNAVMTAGTVRISAMVTAWVGRLAALMNAGTTRITRMITVWVGRLGTLMAAGTGRITRTMAAWTQRLNAMITAWTGRIIAVITTWSQRMTMVMTTTTTRIAAMVTVWLNRLTALFSGWHARQIAAWNAWRTRLQATMTTLINGISSLFTRAISTWSSLGSRAGAGYVAQLTGRLRRGATDVSNIVASYAKRLAGGLNPILQAIGERPLALRDGAVVRMAQGGIRERHIAQIARPGEWRVWAEPETGGEAYIPLARSKRGRSRAIAAETVRRLGGGVQWFQGGGITGDTRGLNATFLDRVRQWVAAVGRPFHITSGYRSVERQAQLYQAYLAGRGNLAAKPGNSNHNFGLAIDGPHWGNRNPGAFGLVYRVRGEPWHVEPVDAKALRGGAASDEFGFAPLPEPPDISRTGALAEVAKKAMRHVYDKAVAWSSTALAEAAGGQDISGTAGVSQWRGVVTQALHILGQPLTYLNDILTQMQRESGGNPAVVNRWDSNWRKGTPSVGLMQVIGPTYATHRHPQYDTGPYVYGVSTNPLANVLAGLRYSLSRYGDLGHFRRRGFAGYAEGGMVFTHRHDFDRGGVLRPGLNLVENNTGANEPVAPIGNRESAVSIREAHFHEGIDYDAFLRKTTFMVQAGRL